MRNNADLELPLFEFLAPSVFAQDSYKFLRIFLAFLYKHFLQWSLINLIDNQ